MPTTTRKARLLQELAGLMTDFYRFGISIQMDLFPESGYHVLKNFRYIATHGSQTISSLARFHHVSRQRMSEIVETWVQADWVQLVDNPRHKASKLVQLTDSGRALYQRANQQEIDIADTMHGSLTEKDIYTAISVVRLMHNRLRLYHQRIRKEPDTFSLAD